MSLNYNLAHIKDYEALQSKEEWPKAQVVIFETMVVGLGSITAKNVDEFYARSCFWRLLSGDAAIPYHWVHRMIGLTTNVTTETWRSFMTRHVSQARRDLLTAAARRRAQLEAALPSRTAGKPEVTLQDTTPELAN